MHKKIVTTCCLVAIAVNICFVSSVSYLYNYENDLFTKAFCKNTEQPELMCNGKCFLHETLLQKATNGEVPDVISIPYCGYEYLLESSFLFDTLDLEVANEHDSTYFERYTKLRFSDIFHPPILA